jgi:hypothetical protein
MSKNNTMLFVCFVLITCSVISGCSTSHLSTVGTKPVNLYSSEGDVLEASFTPINMYRGTVKGTFPDGENFKGEYNSTLNREINKAFLATPWGPITGVSSSRQGPITSYITAKGENGTILHGVTQGERYHGFGACRDSKGRAYRIHY